MRSLVLLPLLLVACGSPKPTELPEPPLTSAPSAKPSASVSTPPPPPQPTFRAVATLRGDAGQYSINGSRSYLVRQGDSVQFAQGYLRATSAKGGDFVPQVDLVDAPYDARVARGESINMELTTWSDPFSQKPFLTRWEMVERVGTFGSVVTLENGAWKPVGKDIGYLPSVRRAGVPLTIKVSTPRPRSCNEERCDYPKMAPAEFVTFDGSPAPTMPKGFCPESMVANERGDLYVAGNDCKSNRGQVAYFAPGSSTGTLTSVEDNEVSALVVSADGRARFALDEDVFEMAAGGPVTSVALPAKGPLVDALGFEKSGAGWVAFRTPNPGGDHGIPLGNVLRQEAPGAPWKVVEGPWSAKHSTCSVLGFELSDAADPLFLTADCATGTETTVDIVRRSLRERPQVLPSMAEQVHAYEGSRSRTSVQDASKCPTKQAFLEIEPAKRGEASALLAKSFADSDLAVEDATVAGKPVVVVSSNYGSYASPKHIAALKKALGGSVTNIWCGVPAVTRSTDGK